MGWWSSLKRKVRLTGWREITMKEMYYLMHRILWIALVLIMISCSSLNLKQKPDIPVNPNFIKIPDQVIDQLGVWAFQIWLKTKTASQNADDKYLVEKVTKRIIGAAPASDQFKWEVALIEGQKPNAVAFPGGRIAIYTKLLEFTDRSEDWLAVAISHEVVHVLARDAADRIDEEIRGALLAEVTGGKLREEGLSPEVTAAVMVAMGVLWQGGVVLPFNRKDESQADKAGLILMARAGYNPLVVKDFWEEMTADSIRGHLFEFLSLHPNHETRMRQLDDFLPNALGYIPYNLSQK